MVIENSVSSIVEPLNEQFAEGAQQQGVGGGEATRPLPQYVS